MEIRTERLYPLGGTDASADSAQTVINPIIEKCGGDPLPTEADECWYWTSTEVEGQQTVKAWLYSTASGTMQETPKTQAHKVRPIITINN